MIDTVSSDGREDIKGVPIRKRYLGWMIATSFLSILLHVSLVVSILYLAIIRHYGWGAIIPIFLFFLCLWSVSAFTKFAAMTFRPYDPWEMASYRGKRGIYILAIAVILYAIVQGGVWILGIDPSSTIIGIPLLLSIVAFYLYAIVWGWEIGCFSLHEKYAHELHDYEPDSYLLDYVNNKSWKNVIYVAIVVTLLSFVVGLIAGLPTGLGFFGGLSGFISLLYELAPRGSN